MHKCTVATLVTFVLLYTAVPANAQWTAGSYGLESETVTQVSGTGGVTSYWSPGMSGTPSIFAEEIASTGNTINITCVYYRSYTTTAGAPFPQLNATFNDNLIGNNMFLTDGTYWSDFADGEDHLAGAPGYYADDYWDYTLNNPPTNNIEISAAVAAQVGLDGYASVGMTID